MGRQVTKHGRTIIDIRRHFGDGLMKIQTYEVADLNLIEPKLLEPETCKDIICKAERLELGDDDRKAVDDEVFAVLGLT